MEKWQILLQIIDLKVSTPIEICSTQMAQKIICSINEKLRGNFHQIMNRYKKGTLVINYNFLRASKLPTKNCAKI
jgi:hypothetical protein